MPRPEPRVTWFGGVTPGPRWSHDDLADRASVLQATLVMLLSLCLGLWVGHVTGEDPLPAGCARRIVGWEAPRPGGMTPTADWFAPTPTPVARVIPVWQTVCTTPEATP